MSTPFAIGTNAERSPSPSAQPTSAEFDRYAEEYDAILNGGLSPFGEDKHFFARGRIAWLAHRLRELGEQPKSALDFGCGTGSAAPFLRELVGVESVLGVDVSAESLETARRIHGSERTHFLDLRDYQPRGQIDLAFCHGVFHHIQPAERPAAAGYIYRALRPGGLFGWWELNAWNPGTLYVMHRIPFDRDAITLTARESRRLLCAAGFQVLRTDFLFIFPRVLSWFRWLEPLLTRLPIGGQYLVLCRKPLPIRAS